MNRVLLQIKDCIYNHRERNAFYINGTSFTYEEFGHRIESIRQSLSIIDKEEKVIGLVIHDDIETYAAIFAIWMEGKAYVPINPSHPIERNVDIIRQIGLTSIFDSTGVSDFDGCQTITYRSYSVGTLNLSPITKTPDDELAYILFTSGSTGSPKGVCISRRNLSSFIDSFWRTGINLTEEDRCLQCFDLTFDVSIQSFLVALIKGACVYTVPYGIVKYIFVASLIQEHRISFGAMAPSMLAYLRPYFGELDASSLKTCILTAEACPVDLLEDWSKCAYNSCIYDFYGPTESTIYCTYYKLNREGHNLALNGIVSIGKPMYHVKALIIDDMGNKLPIGQKGELCVAGTQLTPGYWNNPNKNSNSFFMWIENESNYRFYHTGDLCYIDPSGNIMYVGRIDQQAKIQGYRVELSEIEFHSRQFYNNSYQSVAIAFCGKESVTEIALFIEAPTQDKEKLLEYLQSKLPDYMIPSCIYYMNKFPSNSSDKVDRNSLKQLLL